MSENLPPDIEAGEKETLVAFLDYVRGAVSAKAAGMPEDLARKPGVGSGTSVLGLIKHLAGAERLWFEWALLGIDPYPELGMTLAETDTAEALLAAYRAGIARSNEIIAGCDLDRVSVRENRTVRWILLHMIEETARHAGHADILREQADGSIGR